jgi:predicted FMN-binding regulatory protein PaiB
MRARPFGVIVSAGSTGLYGTHLPTVPKDDGRYDLMQCHWRYRKGLASGIEALMIFQGTEGYITSTCYPSKAQHG